MKTLSSVLNEAGHETFLLGGRILVLPFGGRILGLYPASGLNTLWVHPALHEAGSARAFLNEDGWINTGGNRTWISPEAETHVGDPGRFAETYEVPRGVDPAAYRVTEASDTALTLETELEVPFHRRGTRLKLNLSRTITLLNPPPISIPEDISFAGYRQESFLTPREVLPPDARPALWDIAQVPGGGRFILPVGPVAAPRPFIGEPVYRLENGQILCDADNLTSFKFSVRAGDSRGLTLYLHAATERPFLVASRFPVDAPAVYADVPCDDLTDTGHLQQIYVDDGGFGRFGELEHHSPAIQDGGTSGTRDLKELWAFAGPADRLSALAERIVEEWSDGLAE